jgi:hypothetical protein
VSQGRVGLGRLAFSPIRTRRVWPQVTVDRLRLMPNPLANTSHRISASIRTNTTAPTLPAATRRANLDTAMASARPADASTWS